MATQRMNVLKDMKYGTRMLRAGDTVDMKGPDVRLYTVLGVVGPVRRVKAEVETVEKPKPAAKRTRAKKAK